jgi:hypothetical protein
MYDLLTIRTLARERQDMLLNAARIPVGLPFSLNLLAYLARGITRLAAPVSKLFANEPVEPVCCAGYVI